jgi:hypothetical protein
LLLRRYTLYQTETPPFHSGLERIIAPSI